MEIPLTSAILQHPSPSGPRLATFNSVTTLHQYHSILAIGLVSSSHPFWWGRNDFSVFPQKGGDSNCSPNPFQSISFLGGRVRFLPRWSGISRERHTTPISHESTSDLTSSPWLLESNLVCITMLSTPAVDAVQLHLRMPGNTSS